jgi:hypothetical protein
MRSKDLTELARNSDFISGIYNYCDRWCERCPFTARCLLYASDDEDQDPDPQSRDINNAAFWRKLEAIFRETREMIAKWAEEAGVDLNEIDEASSARREKRRTKAAQDSLALAAKKYAFAVDDWFRACDEIIERRDGPGLEKELEETERILEAREVISWYQYQIAVKIMRALSSLHDENRWPDEENFGNDSDGSAKVALIGIDRSVSAWRLMQIAVPEQDESMVPLILSLEGLRQKVERRFPNARGFIRPGFDEVLGKAN